MHPRPYTCTCLLSHLDFCLVLTCWLFIRSMHARLQARHERSCRSTVCKRGCMLRMRRYVIHQLGPLIRFRVGFSNRPCHAQTDEISLGSMVGRVACACTRCMCLPIRKHVVIAYLTKFLLVEPSSGNTSPRSVC